jgi:ribosomal-protein-alanine N-acetyltransferase
MSGNREKEIETRRLSLRQFRNEDLTSYTAIMGDDEVGKWFPGGKGFTSEQAKKSLDNIIQHWTTHGFGIWAVIGKEEEALLGRCGLNLIAETSEVEVDFVIANGFWRRGFATEGAKASLSYGFQVLNLDRVIGLSKPENVASRGVMEKVGMHYVRDAMYWGILCAYYELSKHAKLRST